MEVFENLWEYTDWANGVVLKALEGLGPNVPASSLRLMSHVVNAQSTWLKRLNGETAVAALWEVHELEKIRRINTETLLGLKAALDRFNGRMEHRMAYTSMSGVPFENSAGDTLLQVFNHGTYHRAQIAMDLREKGLEPVNTDYITWVRTR